MNREKSTSSPLKYFGCLEPKLNRHEKIFISLLALIMLVLSACVKDTPAVDFSTVGTIIEILPVNGGGLENLSGAELHFDATETIDSAAIVLNIASPEPLNNPLTITMEVNDGLEKLIIHLTCSIRPLSGFSLFLPDDFCNHSGRQTLRYPVRYTFIHQR
jgi:hypothetical protein